MKKILTAFAFYLVLLGCSNQSQQANPKGLGDIRTISNRNDGFFDVLCADNSREVVTAEDLRSDRVCDNSADSPHRASCESVAYNMGLRDTELRDTCRTATPYTTSCLNNAWNFSLRGAMLGRACRQASLSTSTCLSDGWNFSLREGVLADTCSLATPYTSECFSTSWNLGLRGKQHQVACARARSGITQCLSGAYNRGARGDALASWCN